MILQVLRVSKALGSGPTLLFLNSAWPRRLRPILDLDPCLSTPAVFCCRFLHFSISIGFEIFRAQSAAARVAGEIKFRGCALYRQEGCPPGADEGYVVKRLGGEEGVERNPPLPRDRIGGGGRSGCMPTILLTRRSPDFPKLKKR